MSTLRRSRLRSLWTAAAVLAGAAIAGCGSAGGSHTPSVPKRAFQFSQCMRASGVPNFADPGPRGFQTPGSNPPSPAFRSALNACQKYLPPSGHSPTVPESVRRQELALAQCMRANGVPNFPDPDASGNIQFPITSPIPRLPAFQRAQNGSCKKYLSR
jgi:hypothetical protein